MSVFVKNFLSITHFCPDPFIYDFDKFRFTYLHVTLLPIPDIWVTSISAFYKQYRNSFILIIVHKIYFSPKWMRETDMAEIFVHSKWCLNSHCLPNIYTRKSAANSNANELHSLCSVCMTRMLKESCPHMNTDIKCSSNIFTLGANRGEILAHISKY